MKKTLLFMSAVAVASAAFALGNPNPALIRSGKFEAGPMAPAIEKAPLTRASGAVDFSYADQPYTAYNLSNVVSGGKRFYLLFEMSQEYIKAYAGNQVTGFSVYSPTNSDGTKNTITQGRFFYTTDLNSEEYTQNFTMPLTGFTLSNVSLDTPYTITGEESKLYFGYSFIIPVANNMYYLPVDGQPNDYPGSLIFGYSDADGFPTQFDYTGAAEIGGLCMSVKIEGESLPENMTWLKDVSLPSYLPLSGDGANVGFAVRNMAGNDMSSVEVTASVTGMPDIVQTFEFSPMPFGGSAALTLPGVKANEEAFVDFSLKVTKVNGEAFDGSVNTLSVPAYDEGYLKKVVVEDATGTWCGWCPGGIEALEYLKKTYPEKAIAIGVHYGDEMEIDEYMPYIDAYVGGFPNLTYNRMFSQTPTDPYVNVCAEIDKIVESLSYPSYAEVELEGKSSDDKTLASVSAAAKFKVATSVPHFLSFVIVEDGVGPYLQTNYFKQYRVPMNGWQTKAAQVPTIFKDVARYYNRFPGIVGSLPSEIGSNSVNEFSIDLPLSNVKGNEYRVIAMITNGLTGEIVNAAQIDLTKDNSNMAVDGIESADGIPAEYYNLNGMKVSEPAQGIFIRRQGSKTEKVVIR